MKLNDLIYRYLAANTSGFSNETYDSYNRKLNYLRNHVGGGEVEANTIKPQMIEELKLDLTRRREKRKGAGVVNEPLSPFTIYTSLKTIKYFFDWSYDQGLIENNPMRGVRLPTEPKPKPKAVSTETVTKMLEAAAVKGENWERVRNVALIFCLCDTGARVSGLANSSLDDLDFTDGSLSVVEKGEDPRPVFLSPQTIQALIVWLEWRKTLEPLERTVFINKYGTRLTRGGVYKILKRVADEAGIDGPTNPHAFRHYFAKAALENGIDLSRLSDLMGHSSEAITDKYYTSWNKKELRKAHSQFSPGNNLPAVEAEIDGSAFYDRPAGRGKL